MTSSPAATSAMVDAITTTVKSIASTAVNAITTPTTSSTSGSSPSSSTSFPSSSSSSSSVNHEGAWTTEEYPSTTPTEKLLSVGDLSSSLQHFGWMDYFVFVLMLVVCAIIGFYFGFVEKKGKGKGREQRRGSEALDYLVGGRKMKVFPVSLSLVASFVSGISLLGTSTEIYVYGTQYAFIIITISLSAIISWYIFLPVFCNLQLTSTYEYFERRFDRRIQLFGAILFIIESSLWLPIAVYVPALTFNQVTGIDIHIITPIVCAICTFYTCVGGIKAVVCADFIQGFVMFGSVFLVMIKGTMDVGGFGEVWQRNKDSGRVEVPDWTFDPTVRMSMLAVIVGGTIYKIQDIAISQPTVQRFISLPSMGKIRQTLIYSCFGLSILLLSCVYVGMVTFATYHDCDPLTTKLAKARDQLVPLLVMDVLGKYPGLGGLFVSAVFSAALSSLSTVLNSLSAVILEDFAKPFSRHSLTENQTAIVMKSTVIFFGVMAVAMVYVVEKLGMVLQLSATLQSITKGPMLGIFIVGMCMPWVNSRSVLVGTGVSFLTMGWICIRAQVAVVRREIITPTKPVSVDGCTYDYVFTPPLNSSIYEQPLEAERGLHHVSWLWYGSIGAVLTVVCSNLAMVIFGVGKWDDVDVELVAPFLRKYYKPKKYTSVSKIDMAED